MSGSNANGYGEAKRYLLGLGDLFINDEFVGNLKGSVTMTVTREKAFQRAGNNIADQKAMVTKEEMSLEAEICDLKIAQLRHALGIYQASEVGAKSMRNREVIALVGTTAVIPAKTIAGGIQVSKLDRSIVYVTTTDYIKNASGSIVRVSGGAIASGQNVILEYNFSSGIGTKYLRVGGETTDVPTFEVKYTHKASDGKLWQITIFKAIANTEFEIAFNERESGDYTVHNIMFKALADITKPEGVNLFEIIEEA